MKSKNDVTFHFVRCLIVVGICGFLFSVTTPVTAYTKSDVKRGEDMIATKNYKGAIELLSGISKDFDFCAASAEDAAIAGMLLCDAYRGTGEQTSDAYKTGLESTKAAIVQVWASAKKTEPDVKKRLEKMAKICKGHPQAFAEFCKSMLPKMVETAPKTDALVALDIAFTEYQEELSIGLASKDLPDFDLLSMIGSQYSALKEWKSAVAVLSDLLSRIPADKEEFKAAILFEITEICYWADDYEGIIKWAKEALKSHLTVDQQLEATIFLVTALDMTGQVDAAVQQLRGLMDRDVPAESKNYWLSKITDIYFRAKRYTEAAKAFDELSKAFKVDADTKAMSRYYKGLCYWETGMKQDAIASMTSLAETGTGKWANKAKGQLYFWDE